MNEADRAVMRGAMQAALANLPLVTSGQGVAGQLSGPETDVREEIGSVAPTVDEAMDTSGMILVTHKKKRARPGSQATTPNSPPSSGAMSGPILVTPTPKPIITFLLATVNGEKVDFNGISPLEVGKRLSSIVSKQSIKKIKPRRDGSLLVEVAGEGDLLEVRAIAKLGDWDISHQMTLPNPKTCIGVISGVHPMISMSELKEVAESPALIIKVDRLVKRTGAVSTETRSVSIVFDSESLPEEIKIGYNIHKVRLYIPDAKQCYKCRV